MTDLVPMPATSDEKEVYAFYGLAAFSAQVLEKALVSVLALLAAEGAQITRDEFTALFNRFDSRTFGQLLRRFGQALPLSSEADALLRDALAKRNFLVHQFFAARAAAFQIQTGRVQMIEELRGLIALFHRAEDEVAVPWLGLLKRHGLSEDELDRRAQAIVKAFIEESRGVASA